MTSDGVDEQHDQIMHPSPGIQFHGNCQTADTGVLTLDKYYVSYLHARESVSARDGSPLLFTGLQDGNSTGIGAVGHGSEVVFPTGCLDTSFVGEPSRTQSLVFKRKSLM